MTTPETAPLVLPEHLYCQTPGCLSPVSVVQVRMDNAESDQFCDSCCMAFWTKVLMEVAAAQGDTVPETEVVG